MKLREELAEKLFNSTAYKIVMLIRELDQLDFNSSAWAIKEVELQRYLDKEVK